MIVWHDSVLKRRIRREAIAGFVLVYVKGRLMGELFRASAVALNMVEISLSEGFFFFFFKLYWKGAAYEPTVSWRALFHAIGFEHVCSSFWI